MEIHVFQTDILKMDHISGLRNIAFTYYLPKSITSKLKLDNMKVYVNLQNLLTITKYTGLDPEVGASQANDNVFGLDNGRYPAARIYTFGVSVTF